MGIQEGADSFGRNLMSGIRLGYAIQGDQRDDKRRVQMMEAQEAWRRAQLGLPPPEDEAALAEQAEAQRQSQATEDLNAHVMKSQDFRPTRTAVVPFTNSIAEPSQVGRFSLPGTPITKGAITPFKGREVPQFTNPSQPSPGVTPLVPRPALPSNPGETLSRGVTPFNPGNRSMGGGASRFRRPSFSR